MHASHLDFAQPQRSPRSPWTGALAVVAAVSLAVACWDAVVQWQALRSAQQAHAVLQAAVAPSKVSKGSATAPRSGKAGTDAGRAERWQAQALHSLHLPWLPLLDAVERAGQAPVALRQLSVDARFSRLQLQIESRALPEVFAYMSELQRVAQSEANGPLASVQLLGHEWLGQPPATYVRARLAVTLRQPGAALESPDAAPATGSTLRVARSPERP